MIEHSVGGLPLVASTVIETPFVHGFTTRKGGVSAAPFAELNLGLKWGDEPEAVGENRRRLRGAAGGTLYWARQIHGRRVIRVHPGDEPDAVAGIEADGLCSNAPGVVVCVYVADCVPILMADPVTGAFAAVHAGWRGAAAGVVDAALDLMASSFGTRAADVRVALGPSIGPCCFEVGEEVVAAIEARVSGARGAGAIHERSPRPHVDLRLANVLGLRNAGVPVPQIEYDGDCTRCQPHRFFSYRRDGGRTGQHVGFIGRAA